MLHLSSGSHGKSCLAKIGVTVTLTGTVSWDQGYTDLGLWPRIMNLEGIQKQRGGS